MKQMGMFDNEVLVYTSNFASVKSLVKAGITPVGIACRPPHWYRGAHELRLAPTPAMLAGWRQVSPHDPERARQEYNDAYQAILAELDPREVLDALTDRGAPVALLCFEAKNILCHRRAAAEWLETKLGLIVPEFGLTREQCCCYLTMPEKAH